MRQGEENPALHHGGSSASLVPPPEHGDIAEGTGFVSGGDLAASHGSAPRLFKYQAVFIFSWESPLPTRSVILSSC